MNSPKVRALVLLNPKASRAEAVLPRLVSWFTENSHAVISVCKSGKESELELEAHGREVDLIVIGGGDGTISKAMPQLLELKRTVAVLPLVPMR